jgi:hypothetical protein
MTAIDRRGESHSESYAIHIFGHQDPPPDHPIDHCIAIDCPSGDPSAANDWLIDDASLLRNVDHFSEYSSGTIVIFMMNRLDCRHRRNRTAGITMS